MKLYTKILLWFFLNLVVLAIAFYAVFRLQFQFGLDSLLMGQAGDRIQALSEVINSELKTTPETGWSDVLKRFGQAYQVQFFLFSNEGTQMAGETISLPEEIKTKVTERRGPFGMGRGPPPGRGRNRELALASTEARSKFVQRTSDPSRYWIGVCLPPTQADQRGVRPPVLLAMTKSLHSGGLFFDLRPWIGVGFAAVLFSVLFWLPMVRSITKAISNVTHATEQIAQGGFDARVEEKRKDELGRLGQAINSMAARLAGFVSGQKRFLGDIAHELCSPIARIEVALGILEQKADEKQKAYVNDVREDVQHMSNLVNELLSFSKAALKQGEIKLTPVELDDLVRQVVEREAVQGNNIKAEMDSTLRVMAEPDLLSRALANLVRNAIRYGGADGQISIAARKEEGRIILSVSDNGPGVPEEYLQKIFDPFFRLDSSRSRETGGTGLGLAIVKTCVEACQGTVSAHNLKPSGLQVEICLTVAAE